MKARNKDLETKNISPDSKEDNTVEVKNVTPDTGANNDSPEQEDTHHSPEQEEVSIDSLQEEIEDLKDKNLRLMAEFDNFRKRSGKEKADLIKYGGEGIMKETLPLIDDFERALEAMQTADDVDAVKEGVELIYDKFQKFLAANGVKEIATENEVFDTDLHEAITTFPVEDKAQKGKIIDCTTKGYTLNDKVIRYAKVVVGE